MVIAKVSVSGTVARATYRSKIPQGIVGATVEFDYADPMWNGLKKTVIFWSSAVKDIQDVGESVVVPAEVVANFGCRLRVGIYGVDLEGNTVIPTLWADLGLVEGSANPGIISGGTDEPISLEHLQTQIGDLSKLQTQSKESLVAAINELAGAPSADLTGVVKSVNGVKPDAKGNVEIEVGGDVSDEQIAQAVEDYMAEHPVSGGVANIYAGQKEPTGDLVWIDTAEENDSLELDAEKWVKYYWCAATGGLQGDGTDPGNGMMMCLSFIPVKAGKKYTIYNTDPEWTSDWIAVNLYELDNGLKDSFVKRVTDTGASITIIIPDNVAYMIFSARNLVGNDAYLNIKIKEVPGFPEPDTPSVPEVLLSNISATYSGGSVSVGTAVSALTGIVVTAHYSDGSSKTVTGYSLSGTIVEGSNVITVSYGGKTTTFTVTGVAEAPDVPVEPEVTLSRISATYNGGDVAVGTAVSALSGIVVTAHYSDGSTATVTGYTLSGTIAEGSNTITVSYGGKTTTFTVTGVAESGGETAGAWKIGYIQNNGNIVEMGDDNEMYYAEYIPVTAGDTVYVYNTNAQWTPKKQNGQNFTRIVGYDSAKNFVAEVTSGYKWISWGRWYTCPIPDGVSFVRVCAANMVGYDDTAVISTEAPNFECAFEDVAWYPGYFSPSGEANTQIANGEMRSTYISVEPGATYRFGNSNAEWTTDWNRCVYFTDMLTFKQAVQPANGATLEFTIPDGVHYLSISCRRMSEAYTTATFEKVS